MTASALLFITFITPLLSEALTGGILRGEKQQRSLVRSLLGALLRDSEHEYDLYNSMIPCSVQTVLNTARTCDGFTLATGGTSRKLFLPDSCFSSYRTLTPINTCFISSMPAPKSPTSLPGWCQSACLENSSCKSWQLYLGTTSDTIRCYLFSSTPAYYQANNYYNAGQCWDLVAQGR